MKTEARITLAIDAMGGDNSPTKVIKGCEIFLNFNKKIKFKTNDKTLFFLQIQIENLTLMVDFLQGHCNLVFAVTRIAVVPVSRFRG